MIRVLIAEDSVTARELLVEILQDDPEIQVVGEAKNGLEAVQMTRRLRPDLVVMDIHMPRMNGFEATKQIMIETPTPIVIVSASRQADEVAVTLHALRAGALANYPKPTGPEAGNFADGCLQFTQLVKALSKVKVVRHWPRPGHACFPARIGPSPSRPGARMVAIVASTGGPAALHSLLSQLPGNFPVPILVVQHIAAGFVAGLASWLNTSTSLQVKVAQEGDRLAAGKVYLAPDDRHLGLADRSYLALSSSAPLGGFRPSGTFLFQAAAQVFSGSLTAVILTGMGRDGADGLQAVRQAGGHVIAQDEDTSVVFGMPQAALETGLCDAVLPLEAIAAALLEVASHGG